MKWSKRQAESDSQIEFTRLKGKIGAKSKFKLNNEHYWSCKKCQNIQFTYCNRLTNKMTNKLIEESCKCTHQNIISFFQFNDISSLSHKIKYKICQLSQFEHLNGNTLIKIQHPYVRKARKTSYLKASYKIYQIHLASFYQKIV